ncbi:MAG: HEAT repeat domain-containing protein, partial [Planctomycetota bacterium]
MRYALVLFLLAGVARSGEPKLRDLFDPTHEAFPLDPYGWEEWEDVPPDARRKARGIDPATWLDPPPDPEPEEKQKPDAGPKPPPGSLAGQQPPKYPPGRFPGFRFEERLRRKQEAFERLVGPGAPSTVEGLIKHLKRIDKALERLHKILGPITEEYAQVKGQVDKISEVKIRTSRKKYGTQPDQILLPAPLLNDLHRKSKRLQRTVALMQSERQFHEWVVRRVGELIAALTPEERARPVAGLKAGLAAKNWRQRLRCGRLLAGLQDPAAVAVFRRALDNEKDPVVLRGHVETAARARVPDLLKILEARLQDPSWPVRAAVIQALGGQRTREAVDLLIARLDQEQGRLKDDILDALYTLTGREMEPDTKTWMLWWEKARAAWKPQAKEALQKRGRGSDQEGVYFYGIRTRSQRIVF